VFHLGILLTLPEKIRAKIFNFIYCTDRISKDSTAPMSYVFLITAFENFTCDIPFRSSDMNER